MFSASSTANLVGTGGRDGRAALKIFSAPADHVVVVRTRRPFGRHHLFGRVIGRCCWVVRKG